MLPVVDVEHVVVGTSHDGASVVADMTLKFVENTVVLVQVTELGTQMVVDVDGLDRLALHCDVPDLQGQVVSGDDISSVSAKLTIGNGRDDFRKEGL